MTEYKNNPKQDKFINLLLLFALLLCITLLALLTRQIIGLQNYIQTSMEHFEEVIHQQGNIHEETSYQEYSGSISVTEDTPVLGNLQEANVIIVEFTDFQCPYCATALTQINQIIKENPDIALIHKDISIRTILLFFIQTPDLQLWQGNAPLDRVSFGNMRRSFS